MLVSLIRSVLLYFLLIAAVRLMGKRQIGQLEPSEFVVALVIADLAAVPMQDLGTPLLAGVIPILTVLALEVLLSVLSYRFLGIRNMLCGTPVVLIENGRLIEANLKKTRVTADELMEQLRQNNLFDLSKVHYAVLETNGQISAFPISSEEPVRRGDLNLQSPAQSVPTVLISGGRILQSNLAQSVLDEKSLQRLLTKQKLKPEQIFLLTVDQYGTVYLSESGVEI